MGGSSPSLPVMEERHCSVTGGREGMREGEGWPRAGGRLIQVWGFKENVFSFFVGRERVN